MQDNCLGVFVQGELLKDICLGEKVRIIIALWRIS